MNIQRKYHIEKNSFPIDGVYRYNAQVYISIDGGNNYYYSGIGRFCKTLKEAKAYCKQYKANHA